MASVDDVRRARDGVNFPTLIVLDDDPTGTQSVANLPVIAHWDAEDFRWALRLGAPAVYVMTNTRAMCAQDAERINAEVVRTASAVAAELDISVAFVSRSDSTLRGHFPLEPDTIIGAGGPVDAVLVVPAFPDAGRVTIGGVHYCTGPDGQRIRVGESEYARDNTFGYRASDLGLWIKEKTKGRVKAGDVVHIGRDVLDKPGAVASVLTQVSGGQYVTADAESEADLRKLALGVIEAYKAGKTFVHRVGPPYVRALIGMAEPAVVSAAQINALLPGKRPDHGLVVVGSHVPTTTRQLRALTEAMPVEVVELDVPKILADPAPVIGDAVAAITRLLGESTVVVHTSREVVAGADEAESLAIARKVNAALIETVRQVVGVSPPRFVIAKGGITSSDVAKFSLMIRHALVIGPLEPGIISVWLAQDGPGVAIPYVVFAGNVGSDASLVNAVSTLSKEVR